MKSLEGLDIFDFCTDSHVRPCLFSLFRRLIYEACQEGIARIREVCFYWLTAVHFEPAAI